MVVKIEPTSSPFTPGEWYKHFFLNKKKNSLQIRILIENFKNYELKYPFLDESQHWGRVYEFLRIPHLCGKINRVKLKKLYTFEQKYNPRLKKLKIKVTNLKDRNHEDDTEIVNYKRFMGRGTQLPQLKNKNCTETELINKNESDEQIQNESIDNQIRNDNICDSAETQKKVRFKNAQILSFDQSNSSESEFYSDCNNSLNNIVHNGETIHKSYFVRLNDSLSNESISNSENDNDTGIVSPVVFSDEESDIDSNENSSKITPKTVISNKENNNNLTLTVEKKSSILAPIPISSCSLDILRNDSAEDKESVTTDNETGVVSPCSFSCEEDYGETSDNMNNTTEANTNHASDLQVVASHILTRDKIKRKLFKNNDEINIEMTGDNIAFEEENSSDERLVNKRKNLILNLGKKLKFVTTVSSLSSDKTNTSLNNDNNMCENIANLRIINQEDTCKKSGDKNPHSGGNVGQVQPLKTLENVDLSHEGSSSDSLNDSINILPIGNIAGFTCNSNGLSKSGFETNALTISETPKLLTTTEASDLETEHHIHFIPPGNLILPTADHLENYRHNSSSSNNSESESMIQREMGLDSIPVSSTKLNSTQGRLVNSGFGANTSAYSSKCLEGETNFSLSMVYKHNLKLKSTEPDSELLIANSNPRIKLFNNNKKENIQDIYEEDKFPQIISNSESGSSENLVHNSFSNELPKKREPLKLISNTVKRMRNSSQNKCSLDESRFDGRDNGKENVMPSISYSANTSEIIKSGTNENNSIQSFLSNSKYTNKYKAINEKEIINSSCENDILLSSIEKHFPDKKKMIPLINKSGSSFSNRMESDTSSAESMTETVENAHNLKNIAKGNRKSEKGVNDNCLKGSDSVLLSNLIIEDCNENKKEISSIATANLHNTKFHGEMHFENELKSQNENNKLLDSQTISSKKDKTLFLKSSVSSRTSKSTLQIFDESNIFSAEKRGIPTKKISTTKKLIIEGLHLDNSFDELYSQFAPYEFEENASFRDYTDQYNSEESPLYTEIITSSPRDDHMMNETYVRSVNETEIQDNKRESISEKLNITGQLEVLKTISPEKLQERDIAISNKIIFNENDANQRSSTSEKLKKTDQLATNMNENFSKMLQRAADISNKIIFKKNYVDSTSSEERNVICRQKKLKRKRKKISSQSIFKKSKNTEGKSYLVTSSDDLESVRKLQEESRKELASQLERKTATSNKMIIGQQQEKNETIDTNSNIELYDSIGAQRISQEIKLRKASIVKQQIKNTSFHNSTDTSQTNELFINPSLARRIYYLNK